MSELAFNINGEAFEVTEDATGWRVRRMRAKGSPEVVYGKDGLPLILPIDAEHDDLRSEVTVSGRYRLDLVDQNNRAIADVPSGYVQVNLDAPMAATAGPSALMARASDNIVIEAMRTQAAMALAVIERFPQVMDSAATLLRAADGAGLPAREPRGLVPEQDDEDEDDDDDDMAKDTRPAFDLQALLSQLAPILMMAFGNGKKGAGLAGVLDWRKAAKSHADEVSVSPPAQIASVATVGANAPNASDAAPPIDGAMMAHLMAVQAQLTSDEAAIAREVAKELSPGEQRAWFEELRVLNVPDAAQKIRELVHGLAKTGGAS